MKLINLAVSTLVTGGLLALSSPLLAGQPETSREIDGMVAYLGIVNSQLISDLNL